MVMTLTKTVWQQCCYLSGFITAYPY